MVGQTAELNMDAIFHALAHHVRRDMLSQLATRDRTVGELAKPFAITLAAASKHVKVLEQAGLVHRNVQGRQHVCGLSPGPLALASEWLQHYERFWTDRLDQLDAMFRAQRVEEQENTVRRSNDDSGRH